MNSSGGSDGDGGPNEGTTDASGLPAVDFSTFVLSLGHSALMHLGVAPDPDKVTGEPNLVMAQQTIDLISLLAEKTRGNLTGEEERLMEQLLYDLRSQYVSVSSNK